jgi:hypothetical protein
MKAGAVPKFANSTVQSTGRREDDAHRPVHQGQPGVPGPAGGRQRAAGDLVRTAEHHRQRVTLRRQEAIITRDQVNGLWANIGA